MSSYQIYRSKYIIHKALTKLDLSSNKITQCTGLISLLPNLQIFKCSFNFIKQLVVENETKLTEIDMSFNKIKSIDVMSLQWNMKIIKLESDINTDLMQLSP